MKNFFFRTVSLFLSLFTLAVFAAPQSVRWTGAEDKNAELGHVLDVIRAKTGIALTAADFMLVEKRDLATSHYQMYVQLVAKVPVKSQNLRIWKHLKTAEAIQVEARVDASPPWQALRLQLSLPALGSAETMELVRHVVRAHIDDPMVRDVRWEDAWSEGRLVRIVTVTGRRGKHTITLSIPERRVLDQRYTEFPQADELTIPVQVYPIYEEVEKARQLLPRIPSELKYLKAQAPRPTASVYQPLLEKRYPESKHDPILGMTEEGQKQGLWAMSWIKIRASQILESLPLTPNALGGQGVVLDGRYATVSLHPEVTKSFKDLNFKPQISGQFKPNWQSMAENPDEWEMIPGGALLGRPIPSAEDAWQRPARRLPNHDATSYINDGFDELQVYWSVNQMFDSLRPMGFTDPELSTRRFHAFLYDPDISYRDNAYYTDDTINFTTYSAESSNMARDNTTIWHELGHGVMDRLMGEHIKLADTGGLSEGMADFVAQLVLNDVTEGKPFEGKEDMRVLNKTGFYLTNEIHDDGEAYGGSMNDMLEASMKAHGKTGLVKVNDLILEAMRLTRNHPGLTAVDWFEHVLFADALGNPPLRAPGEMKTLILESLSGRNFTFDGKPAAVFTLKNGADEVTSTSPGSRENPIRLKLPEASTATYKLSVRLQSVDNFRFRYPVTVKVQLRGGPLQGAVHWEGEEAGAILHTLNSEEDTLPFDLTVRGKCDEINRPDNSCVDFAYVQIWNHGETKDPQAKKRFYLRIYPQRG